MENWQNKSVTKTLCPFTSPRQISLASSSETPKKPNATPTPFLLFAKMRRKKSPIVGIRKSGMFYIVDFANGLRIITTEATEKRVAKLRAAKRKKKR